LTRRRVRAAPTVSTSISGLSWQVVPTGMEELFADPDPQRAERAMRAMFERPIDIAALRDAADGVPAR
jgi:hypothetical protein